MSTHSLLSSSDSMSLPCEQHYEQYLKYLLQGKSSECATIVSMLLADKVTATELYLDLFQRSLYRIGDLWECNRISVAVEHLATAITERMLALVYPTLLVDSQSKGQKVILSCSANEYHQIGARMIADIMENHGFDVDFLGANTPVEALLQQINKTRPDLVGLSVSVYFNMASIHKIIEKIQAAYPQLDIFVGGQAFRWGGDDIGKKFSRVEYISSLAKLQQTFA